jgi:hypothetical protein
MMAFAPEDKRAWLDSEVMSELEKVAKETNLLNGPPAEAFEPISEKTAGQPVWEDEDVPESPRADSRTERHAEMVAHSARLMGTIERMAQDLAEAGHTKAAYRLERTLAALKDITEKGGE